jgi:hypothetical protein
MSCLFLYIYTDLLGYEWIGGRDKLYDIKV